MLLIECSKIKKYFGDRLLLDIDHLKIYSEDKIGIVGANGVGKTTLMNILSQRLDPDAGWVKVHGNYSYITQLEEPEGRRISDELASKLGIEAVWRQNMSGGEKTRFKLAEALGSDSVMLFADEPTSNVDMEGIQLMEERFQAYQGGLIVISHDRSFVDAVASHVMTIENHKIKIFPGNYSACLASKNKSLNANKEEIEKQIFILKNRLSEVIGRLSMPSKGDDIVALDKEYHEILGELEKLKSR